MRKDYKNVLMLIMFVLVLGISLDVSAASSVSCTGVFTPDFLSALRNYVYIPIKWATPILLLVLTSFDFAKVVFSGKKEEMDKAKNNFLKRLVAALVIFFAPDIVILLTDLVSNGSIKACLPSFK